MEKQDYALDWDSSIENKNEYNLMPAGTEVDFTVREIEKGRNVKWNCPMMKIKMECTNPECGKTTVFEQISLHTKAQFFITQFFAAIGLLNRNEKKSIAAMVKDAIGLRGRARLKIDTWEGKDGNKYSSNKIDRYLIVENARPMRDMSGSAPTTEAEDDDCPF